MFLATANSSSFWEPLLQAAEAAGWLWILLGAAEIFVWVALWRGGFQVRRLPDFLLAALAKVRGLFRLN